ncbi:carbohydrate-binding module family 20 domain-containing protein [Catenulispora rubra]|uniref:carbohydrate-binding module family 20 domain-containing protein n=1 Tax=Catenulispora rubra TaxID=280293 RepID=UPI0034DCEC58
MPAAVAVGSVHRAGLRARQARRIPEQAGGVRRRRLPDGLGQAHRAGRHGRDPGPDEQHERRGAAVRVPGGDARRERGVGPGGVRGERQRAGVRLRVRHPQRVPRAGYPVWSATVALPPNTAFEYKYIKKDPDGTVEWESGGNRTSSTGASGSVTLNDSWK